MDRQLGGAQCFRLHKGLLCDNVRQHCEVKNKTKVTFEWVPSRICGEQAKQTALNQKATDTVA